MELLHHLLSNDHGEWTMMVSYLVDQWPVLRVWASTQVGSR